MRFLIILVLALSGCDVFDDSKVERICPGENCSGHGTCQVTSEGLEYCLCDEGYFNASVPYSCIEHFSCNDKPVIYLYPETETDVRVEFTNPDTVSLSYPLYGADGWSVRAYPDGKLCDRDLERCYYSLYWEGPAKDSISFNTGFSVHRDHLISFFEEKLEILGLNYRESQEFIIYWLPILAESSWNIIHFATDSWVSEAPLEVTPVPDTQIRFLMIYKPAEKDTEIEIQVLSAPERKGFTLVEWGGRLESGEYTGVAK